MTLTAMANWKLPVSFQWAPDAEVSCTATAPVTIQQHLIQQMFLWTYYVLTLS
jgi:hypothetical protein